MFDKLKSIFIIDDEAEKQKGANPAASKAESKAPVQGKTNPMSEEKVKELDGKPAEKFVNRLLSALEENNIQGFDYLEYKSALQNLGNVDMDEATRYKSGLAMATTMGADAPKLISSAKHYLAVLQKEEQKFLQAFQSQQSKLVADRDRSLKELENAIAKKEQQIAQLTKEVESHKATLEKKKSQVLNADQKVQVTKANFYASYNTVTQQIAEDIKKMESYLK